MYEPNGKAHAQVLFTLLTCLANAAKAFPPCGFRDGSVGLSFGHPFRVWTLDYLILIQQSEFLDRLPLFGLKQVAVP